MDTHCINCNKCFSLPQDLQRHLTTSSHIRKRRAQDPHMPVTVKRARTAQPPGSTDFGIRLIHRGMSGLFKIYRAQFKRVFNDLTLLATMLLAHIIYLIERAVADTNGIKAQLRCSATFHKERQPEIVQTKYFASKQYIFLHSTNTAQEYAMAMAQIHKNIEECTTNGSGWVLDGINHVDLYVSKYTPIRGNTYRKLPKELASKKAIVNVKNNYDRWFLWSVLASRHHEAEGEVQNPERVHQYRYMENSLNFDGIEFPVAITDIEKFEQQNDLAINVLGYGQGLYPLYTTKNRSKMPINLLLLTPEDGPAHYCWIKNLDRLLFQSSKHHGRKFICPYCLCPFNTAKRLEKHQEFCTLDKQRIEMPEDPILKFRNVHRQIRAPYVMYADFECFLQPQEDGKHHHVPNSYGLLGVRQCCSDSRFEDAIVHRGDEPVKHFLDTIIRKGESYQRESTVPIHMNNEQRSDFHRNTTCHICSENVEEPVRDHCHQCGRYRGAAHADCNTKLYQARDITVFFHNLRKYDGHLIMQELGDVAKDRGLKLECVAKGAEDYISFSIRLQTDGKWWKLRFVDSLAFLNASLDTLVKSAPKEQFSALRQFTDHPNLLLQKGLYPYEFVDSHEKFTLNSLPKIEKFYSSLKLEGASEEDYSHAKCVWQTHGFSNFGQYHDLYLLTDVLLLADIFQGFRDISMQNFGLDPAHYITLPSCNSWDALLKYTNVKLELLEDPDMFQFFTTGIRGGISSINHRYAKANHTGVPDYNAEDPNVHIMYVDANNLYGWAMKQPLPVGEFEWIGEQQHLPSKESGVGYVWEVDLEYPKDLHDVHNNFPMAPEHMQIGSTSPYCQRLKNSLDIDNVALEKLVPNLHHKKHYIVHHQNLKLYMAHGLKLTKIHRGIRFKEAPWMSSYINFNTRMRQLATTQFQKDLFKLLNNAVFGKSMENVFGYLDVRLVADAKKYEKLVANPLYKESHPFKHDLTAVMMNKEKAVLNKPIYTGFSVLELSKTLMYIYHYEYMVPKYGSNIILLFTDTDSFCYAIKTNNIYDDMVPDRDLWFDTSDYPPNHPLHSNVNKKKIGMMKDETMGVPILEFVGLRAKMYSIKTAQEEHMRAKGVTRAVVKTNITHEDYKASLFRQTFRRDNMLGFRSKDHEIYTVNVNKISLSAYDDKRYILDDGITTLAYGHYKIDEESPSPSLLSQQSSICLREH